MGTISTTGQGKRCSGTSTTTASQETVRQRLFSLNEAPLKKKLLGWEEVLQNLGRQSDVLARTTALEAVHSIFPSAGKGQSSMAIRRSSRHILPPNSNNIFRNTISSPSLWWSSLEALLPPGHIPLELQDEARMELASLLSHYPSTPSPTLKQQILLLRAYSELEDKKEVRKWVDQGIASSSVSKLSQEWTFWVQEAISALATVGFLREAEALLLQHLPHPLPSRACLWALGQKSASCGDLLELDRLHNQYWSNPAFSSPNSVTDSSSSSSSCSWNPSPLEFQLQEAQACVQAAIRVVRGEKYGSRQVEDNHPLLDISRRYDRVWRTLQGDLYGRFHPLAWDTRAALLTLLSLSSNPTGSALEWIWKRRGLASAVPATLNTLDTRLSILALLPTRDTVPDDASSVQNHLELVSSSIKDADKNWNIQPSSHTYSRIFQALPSSTPNTQQAIQVFSEALAYEDRMLKAGRRHSMETLTAFFDLMARIGFWAEIRRRWRDLCFSGAHRSPELYHELFSLSGKYARDFKASRWTHTTNITDQEQAQWAMESLLPQYYREPWVAKSQTPLPTSLFPLVLRCAIQAGDRRRAFELLRRLPPMGEGPRPTDMSSILLRSIGHLWREHKERGLRRALRRLVHQKVIPQVGLVEAVEYLVVVEGNVIRAVQRYLHHVEHELHVHGRILPFVTLEGDVKPDMSSMKNDNGSVKGGVRVTQEELQVYLLLLRGFIQMDNPAMAVAWSKALLRLSHAPGASNLTQLLHPLLAQASSIDKDEVVVEKIYPLIRGFFLGDSGINL